MSSRAATSWSACVRCASRSRMAATMVGREPPVASASVSRAISAPRRATVARRRSRSSSRLRPGSSSRVIASAISLGNKTVATDVLGDAYEYLIGKFADVTRRNKAGEFCTPRSVVRMIVELLDPKGGGRHTRVRTR